MGIPPRLISAASCSGAETNLPVKFHYGLPEHSQRDGWKPPGATPALRSHSSFFKEKSSRFQHLKAPEGTCHTAWGHLGQTWLGRRIKVPLASLLRRQRFIYQLIDRFVPPITELRKQLLLNTGAEERGSHFQTPFGGFSPTANQSELPLLPDLPAGIGMPKDSSQARGCTIWGCDTSQNSSGGLGPPSGGESQGTDRVKESATLNIPFLFIPKLMKDAQRGDSPGHPAPANKSQLHKERKKERCEIAFRAATELGGRICCFQIPADPSSSRVCIHTARNKSHLEEGRKLSERTTKLPGDRIFPTHETPLSRLQKAASSTFLMATTA